MIVNKLGFFEGMYSVSAPTFTGTYRPFNQDTGETADSNLVEIRFWQSGILGHWVAYMRNNEGWEIGNYEPKTGFTSYTESPLLNWLKETVLKAMNNADNTNSAFITELPKS